MTEFLFSVIYDKHVETLDLFKSYFTRQLEIVQGLCWNNRFIYWALYDNLTLLTS